MEILKMFGKNVANKRKLMRYSQEQLAELIGLSPKSISNIETGRGFIALSKLELLCKVLQATPSQLFKITDTIFTDDKIENLIFINELIQNLNEKELKILAVFIQAYIEKIK